MIPTFLQLVLKIRKNENIMIHRRYRRHASVFVQSSSDKPVVRERTQWNERWRGARVWERQREKKIQLIKMNLLLLFVASAVLDEQLFLRHGTYDEL